MKLIHKKTYVPKVSNRWQPNLEALSVVLQRLGILALVTADNRHVAVRISRVRVVLAQDGHTDN